MAIKIVLGTSLVRNGSRMVVVTGILLSLVVVSFCHVNVNGQVDGNIVTTSRRAKLSAEPEPAPRLTHALVITTTTGVSSFPKPNNTTRSPEPEPEPDLEKILENRPDEISSTPVTQDQDQDAFSRKLSSTKGELPLHRSKKDTSQPEITSFHIQSDIRYRYSRTHVTSRVANRHLRLSQEVTFRIVLPETAFISKFIMEIENKSYEAYVTGKEHAKWIYTTAQKQGHSAGLVETQTRNSNIFTVNVNIKARSKVNFKLTYEELLQRRLGRYEQSISIAPAQMNNVHDFQVIVSIKESQNITLLRIPTLRNVLDGQDNDHENNKDAVILRPAGNMAHITWKATPTDQAELAEHKLTGKFVVQYDISRELDSGEVFIMNGYFVHFFSPANLVPLGKHIVFVVDVSGSMEGTKMKQLKVAMTQILADLGRDDFFNIITFSTGVNLWLPNARPKMEYSWLSPAHNREPESDKTLSATEQNIEIAQKYISTLSANGGTNIHGAIMKALELTNLLKTTPEKSDTNYGTKWTGAGSGSGSGSVTTLPPGVESLIIFLTDGEPTQGVRNPSKIQELIQAANSKPESEPVPIYSLAFGQGASFPFLRKLSLQNQGFARRIYEAADAALQLQGFYNEIASPLLSNVNFNYTSPEYTVSNLTTTKFATVFEGAEIAVCGTLDPTKQNLSPTLNLSNIINEAKGILTEFVETTKVNFNVVVNAFGKRGFLQFMNPVIWSANPIPWQISDLSSLTPIRSRRSLEKQRLEEDIFLEKVWAYLTIKQLIDRHFAGAGTSADKYSPVKNDGDREVVPETSKEQALRLALKYGFVTPLTSLVIVTPDQTDISDTVSREELQDSKMSDSDFSNDTPDWQLSSARNRIRMAASSAGSRSNVLRSIMRLDLLSVWLGTFLMIEARQNR